MKPIILLVVFLGLFSGMYAATAFAETNVFAITDETLPVELSSFSATVTARNLVQLQWTTQSESNLQGYYIFRNTEDIFCDAMKISGLIQPTNTSSLHNYEYTDEETFEEGTYYYWLYSIEIDGTGVSYGPVSVLMDNDVEDETPVIPVVTGIKSIFPNPFNPSTTISYVLPDASSVKIDVFNARGQLVQSHTNSHSTPGEYRWDFNGVDKYNQQLSSGVYQVVLTAKSMRSVQKMVLMK